MWSLSGLSFFLDALRIPLFVPILFWLSIAALHRKADHFYRIGQKVSEQKDVYVTPSDPGSILGRAMENDDRIILVAAGGGGIQASAWTARVLTGLEVICAEKAGSIFSIAKAAERGFWWQRRDYVFRDSLQACGIPLKKALVERQFDQYPTGCR